MSTCGVHVAHIFTFLCCVFCLVSDCSVSCVQCWLCLWIVQSCLWSFCVLYPVLPMSKDWPVLLVIVLGLVSSVPNVYGVSSLVSDCSVSCAQCSQCLWIVQSCLWSLCILCPVLPMSIDCPVLFVIALYLVSSVANVYGLSSLVCDRSVSCAWCCLYLWIVQSWLPYWFSVTFMYKQLVSILYVNFQLNIYTCGL
jgi:hypothetical protein